MKPLPDTRPFPSLFGVFYISKQFARKRRRRRRRRKSYNTPLYEVMKGGMREKRRIEGVEQKFSTYGSQPKSGLQKWVPIPFQLSHDRGHRGKQVEGTRLSTI